MSHPFIQLLSHAYSAFNLRDIEGVLSILHPDVDWPNLIEGGRLHGHNAVRDYWIRQFGLYDSQITPLKIAADPEGSTLVVEVHQLVRSPLGQILSESWLQHTYTLKDGLIGHLGIDHLAPVLDVPSLMQR